MGKRKGMIASLRYKTQSTHTGYHKKRLAYVECQQTNGAMCSCSRLSVINIIEIVSVLIMHIIRFTANRGSVERSILVTVFSVSGCVCIMSAIRWKELQVACNRIEIGRISKRISKRGVVGETSVG